VIKQLGTRKKSTGLKSRKLKKKTLDCSIAKENKPVSNKTLKPKVIATTKASRSHVTQIPNLIQAPAVGPASTFLLTSQGNLVPVITPAAGVLTPVFINKPPLIVLQPPPPAPPPPPIPQPVVVVPANKKRINRESTVTTFSNKRPISALSKHSHAKREGKCAAHKNSGALQPKQVINTPAVSPTAAFLNSFPVVASTGLLETEKVSEVVVDSTGAKNDTSPIKVVTGNKAIVSEPSFIKNTILVATLDTTSMMKDKKSSELKPCKGNNMDKVDTQKAVEPSMEQQMIANENESGNIKPNPGNGSNVDKIIDTIPVESNSIALALTNNLIHESTSSEVTTTPTESGETLLKVATLPISTAGLSVPCYIVTQSSSQSNSTNLNGIQSVTSTSHSLSSITGSNQPICSVNQPISDANKTLPSFIHAVDSVHSTQPLTSKNQGSSTMSQSTLATGVSTANYPTVSSRDQPVSTPSRHLSSVSYLTPPLNIVSALTKMVPFINQSASTMAPPLSAVTHSISTTVSSIN